MEPSEILEQIPIEEYIGQYVDLQQRGREFWGLSPFKDEKTPSFSVRPGDSNHPGIFCDFSSGHGGNLIEFVKLYHNVSVAKAVCMLKQYAGINDDGEQTGEISRLNAAKIARKFKPVNRKLAKPVYKILNPKYMDNFEFDRDKLQLWADEGISWDVMQKRGVRYDALSDRIVYPIKNLNGDIISVCGRTCDPDFKSKRLPKYIYFQQMGTVDTFYGFSDHKDSILDKKEFIIFEGAKSVMLAEGWGIDNAGAALTSHLNEHQYKVLVKLGVRIVIAFDKDAKPNEDENIQKLKHFVPVEIVRDTGELLGEKDSPVDKGFDVWQKLYNERRRLK